MLQCKIHKMVMGMQSDSGERAVRASEAHAAVALPKYNCIHVRLKFQTPADLSHRMMSVKANDPLY